MDKIRLGPGNNPAATMETGQMKIERKFTSVESGAYGDIGFATMVSERSEERRVGKEC